MGFIHLDNMTLYDSDNATELGTSAVARTAVSVVVPITSGRLNRLFNAAKTDIDKTLILYATFTTESNSDGIYYVYDDGDTVQVAACGYALWMPKAQLGIAWIGTEQIAVARGESTTDVIEIYDYSNGTVTLNRTVVSHATTYNGIIYYRTARPMIDNNSKALVYFQGYFNAGSYENFITDGHIYDLETNELLV
jgi:hypothetical protein